MRVLVWHVHGGYTDAFVRGRHEYLVPVNADRDTWGGGLHGREWPAAREVAFDDLRESEIDVVVLQRPEEISLVERLTGRRPGRDLPAVYLEHNTPRPSATGTVHPVAERRDIPIVHVTHFNRVFWDNGVAPVHVVPHGVHDPGERYTGELARAAVVVNEPMRRWRVTGTDLLPAFARVAPLDVFGMGGDRLPDAWRRGGSGVVPAGDLAPRRLHDEMARRRVYVHPFRWTSLGLALLEAMHLGMPVIGLAATEAPAAVPPHAGFLTNDLDALQGALRDLVHDRALARERGRAARRHALAAHGLGAFLSAWDAVLAEVVVDADSVVTGASAPITTVTERRAG